MSRHYPIAIDSYENTRSKALQKIKAGAKKSNSEVLDELSHELDPKKIAARRANIEAARMVVDKCLDSYREGEYEFPVTVRMICEALKAIK
jgi:hypothetical protein